MKKILSIIYLVLFFTMCTLAKTKKAEIRYFKNPQRYARFCSYQAICPEHSKGAVLRIMVNYNHPKNGKCSIRLLKDLKTNIYYANAQKGKSSVWHEVDPKNPNITWEFAKDKKDPTLADMLKKLVPVIKKYEQKVATEKVSSRQLWKEKIMLEKEK